MIPKFRAWNAVEQKMVRVTRLNWEHPSGLEVNGSNIVGFVESVMMCIGKKDKNGVDIYDGDICNFIIMEDYIKYNPINAFRVVIEQENGCWGFRHLFPDLVHEDDRRWKSFWNDEDKESWCLQYFEVVGNIYENPDMAE